MDEANSQLIDLSSLQMKPGEGRKLDLAVDLSPITMGGETYSPNPKSVSIRVHVSRMLGGGYSLKLEYSCTADGPCMRCLESCNIGVDVLLREQDQGGEDELVSPYISGDDLDFGSWAHDGFVLCMPKQLTCREDCRGLCPNCGENLNVNPDHRHEAETPSRWSALDGLSFDDEGKLVVKEEKNID